MINLKTAIKTNVIEIIKNCYLITFYDNNLEYWAMQSYKKLICIYCPTTKELLIDKNNFDCTKKTALHSKYFIDNYTCYDYQSKLDFIKLIINNDKISTYETERYKVK